MPRTAEVRVVFGGCAFHRRNPARATSTEPITMRIKSRPMPGQPLAKVEYKRRKEQPLLVGSPALEEIETLKRALIVTLSRVWTGAEGARILEFDNSRFKRSR